MTPQTDPSAGFGGVSPDTWRNLMMMGANLSTAANARNGQGFLTYGNGIAGPLGAAVQGTMEGAQKQAMLRSQLQQQQQQIHTSQLQNQMTELQIPLLRQKLLYTQGLLGPDQAPTDMGAAPAATPAAPTPGGYVGQVSQLEGGGQNPRSSANGIGQFTNGTWMGFAKANPQYFSNMDPAQVLEQRNNPDVAHAAIDWLAKQNAPVLEQNGIQPTNGSLGLAHFLGAGPAAAMWKADPAASAAAILQTVLPPDQAKAYLEANPQLQRQTVGQVTAPYRAWDAQGGAPQAAAPVRVASAAPVSDVGNPAVPMAAGSSQGAGILPIGGGHTTPAPVAPSALPAIPGADPKLLAQAQALFLKARQAAVAGIPSGSWETQAKLLMEQAFAQPKAAATAAGAMPFNIQEKLAAAGFRQNTDGTIAPIPGGAADPAYIGAAQRAKEAASNLTTRPGSVNLVQQPTGAPQWVATPERRTRIDEHGNTVEEWATPPVPGAPLPPGSVTTALNPLGQKVKTDALNNFMGEHQTKAFDAAQNGLASMEYIAHGLDTLGPTGWSATGSGADARINLAKIINTTAGVLGVQPPFDPNKVAAWEDVKKESTRLGMSGLAALFGGNREAASIVMTSIGAVPTEANSYEGGRLLVSAYQNGFQRVIDERNFIANKLRDPAANYDITTAREEFNQKFPPALYSRRAISAIKPYEVTTPEQAMKRYMPGTRVTLPDGSPGVVPGDTSLPLQ